MTLNPSTKNILKIAILAIFLVMQFLNVYRPIEIEDVWWHLKAGEWIDHNKAIPIQDPFPMESTEKLQTFTQMYSQWLGSWTFFKAYQFSGEQGLKLLRSILYVVSLLIMFFYARKKIPLAILLWIIFLVAPAIQNRCFLRPLIFNLLFIQAFLILLFSYEKKPKIAKLLFLLPIGTLWSNIHLGSFVYGTTLFGITILANGVSWIKHKSDLIQRQIDAKKVKELCAILGLYWLMFGINPFGLNALAHNWRVFLDPTYIHFSMLNKLIMELQSPGNIFQLGYLWLHIILVANLILLFFVPSRNRFYLVMIYAFSCFFFIYAIRGSDFAILLQFYLMAEAFSALNLKRTWQNLRIAPFISFALLSAITIYGVAIISQVPYFRSYHDQKEANYYREKIGSYNPQKIINFLEEHSVTGPVFNDDLVGGYLIWTAYPRLRPIADGRQTNMDRLFFYISTYNNPENNWNTLNKRFQFSAVILLNRAPESLKFIQYLMQDPSFIFAQYSNDFVLFVNKKFFGEEALNRFDQKKILSAVQLSTQDIKTLEEISLRKVQAKEWWQLLFQKKYTFIDDMEDAILLYTLGYRSAAGKKIIETSKLYPNGRPVPNVMRLMAADLAQHPK